MKLNPQQTKAVYYLDGPLRIVAGAGSGKTRVLTHKIKYLIVDQKINPVRIAAITFTNKATNEMKNRVTEMTDSNSGAQVAISTYHALCVRILRSDFNLKPFSQSFQICDQEDQKILIKKFIRESRGWTDQQLEPPVKNIYAALRFIENFKKKGLYPDHPEFKNLISKLDPEQVSLYEKYHHFLSTHNYLDFNDLIQYTYQLLKSNATIRQKWATKFDYVLVDEFQDTDQTQLEIIQMLAPQNITVVGDPHQMIYGWRGAKSQIFNNFNRLFAGGHTIFLNQNYRSTPEILTLANNFMLGDYDPASEQALVTQRPKSGKLPLIIELTDRYSEARWICLEIKKLQTSGYQPRDIIILMRANYLSRTIEEVFREQRIKFKLLRDFPFWRRAEVKDGLAVLDVLLLGDSVMAWERVIRRMKGIGPVNISKLQDIITTHNLTWSDLFAPEQKFLLSPNLVKALTPVYDLLALRSETKKQTIADIAEQAFKNLHWWDEIDGYLTTIEVENIKELVLILRERGDQEEQRSVLDWKSWFINFIDQIRISQEEKRDDAELRNAVRIMTIHKAKGLESKIIFIITVNEDVLPSGRAVDLQEERRIFYVAMTRAQEQLIISYHLGKRYAKLPSTRSRFINELDTNYYHLHKHHDARPSYNPKAIYSVSEPDTHEKTVSRSFKKGEQVSHPFYGIGKILNQKHTSLIIDFGSSHGIQIVKSGEIKSG